MLTRELRVEARRPGSYWMRVGAGGGMLLLLAAQMVVGRVGAGDGARLFFLQQQLLHLMILLIVPLTTADCISRERREGTLMLLRLTPLSSLGVLLAKVCSRVVAILGWLVAVTPMLAIPLLLGGVTAWDFGFALLLDVLALAVAIGAGMLATTGAERWGVAMFRGVGFSYLASLIFWAIAGLMISDVDDLGLDVLALPVVVLLGFDRVFEYCVGEGTAAVVAFLFSGFLVAGGTLLLCIWGMNRAWRQEPPTAAVNQTKHVFRRRQLFPWLSGFLRRRRLQRNPMSWLQGRSSPGRGIRMGLFLAIAVIEGLIILNRNQEELSHHFILLGLLTVSVALSAAASLVLERQSGALELLLVTPLTANQIIFARFRGIMLDHGWPALLVLAVLYYGTNSMILVAVTGCAVTLLWWFVSALGMFQSLSRKSVMSAFGYTVGICLLIVGLPIILALASAWFASSSGGASFVAAILMAVLLPLLTVGGPFLAVMPWSLLVAARHKLERREFSWIE